MLACEILKIWDEKMYGNIQCIREKDGPLILNSSKIRLISLFHNLTIENNQW